MKSDVFYKKKKDDQIWWRQTNAIGVMEFSFDREKVYNLFRDYPYKMTEEEVQIFNRENPYWADFFAERVKE